MSKPADLTGRRFGRLTAVQYEGKRTSNGRTWVCRCDCGAERTVPANSLRSGNTTSCGCYHREKAATQSTRHGKVRARIYNIWCGMRGRCNNRKHRDYANYGGRGITVCERWQKFESFYADMGDPLPGTSIDRIDNDKGYSPSNCRWATPSTQLANRRCSILIHFHGRTQSIQEWARETGINLNTLKGRFRSGDVPPLLFRPSRSVGLEVGATR